MNEHRTPEAGPDAFSGEAISRADREFLASLDHHPLTRHPLYAAPCPPCPAQPSLADLKAERVTRSERRARRRLQQPSTGYW